MFVGVMPPVDPANGPDAVQWNAHRRYGKPRWAQMMANWRQVAQGYGYQRVHAFRRDTALVDTVSTPMRCPLQHRCPHQQQPAPAPPGGGAGWVPDDPLFLRQPPTFGRRKVYVYGRTSGMIGDVNLYPDKRCNPRAPNAFECNTAEDCAQAGVPHWMRMYASEMMIPLLADSYATDGPAEADLFLVPHQSMCLTHRCWDDSGGKEPLAACSKKVQRNYLQPLLHALRSHGWWNCSGGRDHVLTWTHDGGMQMFQGSHSLFRNATHLSYDNSFQRERNVVIPPLSGHGLSSYMAMGSWAQAALEKRSGQAYDPRGRENLMFFAGSVMRDKPAYSHGVRQALVALYENSAQPKDVVVHDGALRGGACDYTCTMCKTRFLLCPEGWVPWTPRPFEAVTQGAIPVMLSERLQLPGQSWLNWTHFSVRLNTTARSVGEIEPALRRYPVDRVRQMQGSLVRAAPYLLMEQFGPTVIDWVLGEALEHSCLRA
jgi:hypothetical protein